MSDNHIGPYQLNSIITGDAKELAKAIPDESIDLVFTDPIYSNIDDYRWLAETAARVLRPDGALLCWSNGKWHKTHTDWFEDFGLTYRYTFTNIMIRAIAPMNGRIVSKANRVLWFDIANKSRMVGYLADGAATTVDKVYQGWNWSKSPNYTRMCLEAFASIDDVVFDPFAGYGTTPFVCATWGYRYLAFEIDPDTAALARERVRNTQPPLLIPQAEQLALID